jgi:protein tyrosine phosphatase
MDDSYFTKKILNLTKGKRMKNAESKIIKISSQYELFEKQNGCPVVIILIINYRDKTWEILPYSGETFNFRQSSPSKYDYVNAISIAIQRANDFAKMKLEGVN